LAGDNSNGVGFDFGSGFTETLGVLVKTEEVLVMRTSGYLKIIFVVGVLSLLLAGLFTPAIAQRSNPIWTFCTGGRIEINFEGWLPGEALTAHVDGTAVGQYTTTAEGDGRYQFPPTTGVITLVRANGDVIVAGKADCSQPPPGKITDMNLYNLTIPVGGKTTLEATGQDEAGNDIPLDIVWITAAGSFTPEGELTATEEGEFIVTATHMGQASSYSYQMDLIVTAPLTSLEILPPEIYAFPGQGVALNVVATDVNGILVDITPQWDSGGAGEVVPVSFFIAGEELGEFTLTGSIPGTDLVATVIVYITPELASIQITPEIEELFVGDTQQFEVVGFDPEGNEMDVPVPPIWAAEMGIIDANGKYAATAEGDETITAVVDLNAIQGSTPGQRGLAGKKPPITIEWKFPVWAKETAIETGISAADTFTITEDAAPVTDPVQTENQALPTTSTQSSDSDNQNTGSEDSGYYVEADDYCCWCDRLVCWQRIVIFISFWTLLGILLFGLPKWLQKKIPWWSDLHLKVRITAFGIVLVIMAVVSFTVCYW
jgi:hypothetical protein